MYSYKAKHLKCCIRFSSVCSQVSLTLSELMFILYPNIQGLPLTIIFRIAIEDTNKIIFFRLYLKCFRYQKVHKWLLVDKETCILLIKIPNYWQQELQTSHPHEDYILVLITSPTPVFLPYSKNISQYTYHLILSKLFQECVL